MVDRKEIPEKVKLEVFDRAGGRRGELACEGCGLRLMGKAFQYDHQIEEWEQLLQKHERRSILADDVKLLGQDCCHAPKTAKKTKERAHGKRLVRKAAKISNQKRPMPGSKNSPWKAKIGGGWEKR